MTPTPATLAADLGRPAVPPAAGRVLDAPAPWRILEDAAGDGMTLEALAVPYSTPTRIGSFVEEIAPGAVDVEALRGIPLLYRHDEPIGTVVEAADTPAGPLIRARLSETALGRDVATLIRDGAVAGVSIGFDSISRDTSTRSTIRHDRIEIREISATPLPAYKTAKITALREDPATVTATETAPATPAEAAPPAPPVVEATADLDPSLVREILDRVRTLEESPAAGGHPLAGYRSLSDYSRAVLLGTETRALVDQVTDNNPGVIPPAWIRDVKGIVAGARVLIEGIGGPTSLPSAGMDVKWPYYDGDLSTLVGAQSAEKTEITSARVDLKAGVSPISTYAGGSDVSRQLIERSDPSYLDAYLRIMYAAYGRVTEAAFTAAAKAGGTEVPLSAAPDADELRLWLTTAGMTVADATGSPASVAALGKDLYLLAAGGGTPMRDFLVDADIPKIVYDPALGAAEGIVTNAAAAAWLEDGPNAISQDVIAKLGRDVAVYGYCAPAVYVPAGVVYTATAPAGAGGTRK